MIDMKQAKQEFAAYLRAYDGTDDKIKLKVVHTYAVLDAADEICRNERLAGEDHELALLIALLHDIGRFEQLKVFGSFDDRKLDHASFGVKVLFEDGLIRNFIRDDSYDEIIRQAIGCHSLFELPEGLAGREELHCRMIRDADKLDNFRVKDTEKMETMLDVSEEAIGFEAVSPHIMESIRAGRCIRRAERVTHMDHWVSFLAFIFDLNFKASFRWILDRDYMNRNIDRINYQNPGTKQAMEEVRVICDQYLRERAGV